MTGSLAGTQLREIFENQQEITTRTVIWARQLVSPQPKLFLTGVLIGGGHNKHGTGSGSLPKQCRPPVYVLLAYWEISLSVYVALTYIPVGGLC